MRHDSQVELVLDPAATERDPTLPRERRKKVLRRLLPTRDGIRPIRVEVDVNAKRGWRNALRRVTLRHLTTRSGVCQPNVVAGAVAAEAGQPDHRRWNPVDGLATWERELEINELEAEPTLVGTGANSWE